MGCEVCSVVWVALHITSNLRHKYTTFVYYFIFLKQIKQNKIITTQLIM